MTPEKKKRRRRGVQIVVALTLLAIVLPVGFWLYDLLGPNPPLIVSKETTYITSPLDENGLPDYERYLLEQSRKGVTLENNAAVLFWEAMGLGTSDELSVEPGDAVLIAKAIGLELPTKCRPLEPIYGKTTKKRVAEWLGKKLDEEVVLEDPLVERTLELAIAQPWSAEEIPPLAEWVDNNQEALELLVEASNRPKWFSPSPTYLNGQRDMLYSALLPDAQDARAAMKALAVKASMLITQEDIDETLSLMQAISSLAKHQHSGQHIVQSLVGVYGIKISSDILMRSGKSKSIHSKNSSNHLAQLGDTHLADNTIHLVDTTERVAALDGLLHWHEDGGALESMMEESSRFHRTMTWTRININTSLARMDGRYDECVSAAKGGFDEDVVFDEIVRLSTQKTKVQLGTLFSSNFRSERIADIVTLMTLPTIDSVVQAHQHANERHRLIQILQSLESHHVQATQYPESLVALVPGLLTELPADRFHNHPLVYRKTADGFLLYSRGANGVDDGGSNGTDVWGETKHKGRSLDELYWRNSKTGEWELSEESDEVAELRSQIPASADDISIRIPFQPQPWPWEVE